MCPQPRHCWPTVRSRCCPRRLPPKCWSHRRPLHTDHFQRSTYPRTAPPLASSPKKKKKKKDCEYFTTASYILFGHGGGGGIRYPNIGSIEGHFVRLVPHRMSPAIPPQECRIHCRERGLGLWRSGCPLADPLHRSGLAVRQAPALRAAPIDCHATPGCPGRSLRPLRVQPVPWDPLLTNTTSSSGG